MSLDRRVREGFGRVAGDIDPDVEGLLGTTVVRGRRRRLMRRAAVAAAVAVVAAVAIVVGPGVLERLGRPSDPRPAGPGPSPPIEPGQDPYQLIDGVYLVRLRGTEDQAIAEAGLAGTWRMRLDPEGSLSLSPPRRLRDSTEPFTNSYVYRLSGSRFETDALSPDTCGAPSGLYRWELRGEPPGELSFTIVEDGCAVREAVLASEPWLIHQG